MAERARQFASREQKKRQQDDWQQQRVDDARRNGQFHEVDAGSNKQACQHQHGDEAGVKPGGVPRVMLQ